MSKGDKESEGQTEEVCDTKCKQQGGRTRTQQKEQQQKNPTKTKRDSEMVRGDRCTKRKTDKERQNDDE